MDIGFPLHHWTAGEGKGRGSVALFLAASCSFVLTVPPFAHAWGKLGHEMVANIAWNRITDETRRKVEDILRQDDGSYGDDDGAGSPLASVADWADKVKYTHEYHYTAPLHFIDVQDRKIPGGCASIDPGAPTDCHFSYERDCAEDFCVAGAISNFSRHLQATRSLLPRPPNSPRLRPSSSSILRAEAKTNRNYNLNTTTPDPFLRESLMFLTHFVGDIHQPLHSARASDKGGNTIHVNFTSSPNEDQYSSFSSSSSSSSSSLRSEMIPDLRSQLPVGKKHGWNLHAVWDDGIIERAMADFYGGKRENFEGDILNLIDYAAIFGVLERWLACADGRNKTCTSEWAEESLMYALAFAYRNTDDLEVVNGATLSESYFLTRLDVVQIQIAAAGVRLAATLEILLSPQKSAHSTATNTPTTRAHSKAAANNNNFVGRLAGKASEEVAQVMMLW